ncbi:hypothetical protein AHiyo6_26480 [Arthrobacter sp. Hiyo6]|nr:hypothetical protein AHiyo6_26480 [Arthrobacter sp. Hiyo6]
MAPALRIRAATRGASAVMISRCSAAYASHAAMPWSRSSTSTTPDCGPDSASRTRSRCFGRRRLDVQFVPDRGGQRLGIGDEDGRGLGVVFCLADQVRGNEARVGTGVGQNGDLGGSGFRIDAHDAFDEPLGGGHENIAGTGDHVHGVQCLVLAG